MSMTEDDYAREQYEFEFAAEAISASLANTLPSRYHSNPLIAVPAYNALTEARSLLLEHPAASLVLAVTAIEQTIKKVFLEPLVHGLIHEDAQEIAHLIASKTIGHRGWGQFDKLLFHLLDVHGGLDLKAHRRQGGATTLWKEAQQLQKLRDTVVHQGRLDIDSSSSTQAVAVASELLEKLFPALITKLDGWLHVHDNFRICTDYQCPQRLAGLT